MITWLQNFFLKHNKWLFGGLLIVIIVTFVLTIGPQSFFGSSGRPQREAMNYYGYDLSSEADQRSMVMAAEISSIFHPELQVQREQLMDYAYLRVAALGLARQLGIPNPSQEALREYVETFRIFQDPQSGDFSAESYRSIMDAMQANDRYPRESIGRVMREDYRIAQVREALGGPSFALPFEMRKEYLDQQTEFTVTLAHFDYQSYEPDISPSREDLEQFFRENPSRYEIPETLSVTALVFRQDAYLDDVPEPDEADLESTFVANRSTYEEARESSESESEDGEASDLTLDDVREEVLADWRREEARRIAARQSEQFSVRLWQEEIARDSEAFDALLEEFEADTLSVPPYSRNQPPTVAGLSPQLFNSMWIYRGDSNRYFSDIAQTDEGAALLVADDFSEARMPEFEEVRDDVEADYRQSEKRRLFAEEGARLRETIQERLESRSFQEIAASHGLELEELDPFTGENVPQELRQSQVWSQARFLSEGSVSPMVMQDQRGTFAYVADREVPEIEADSEGFNEFIARREEARNDAMGWARLREITDQSLNSLLGTSRIQ
ncbi:MAG: hypothetical protein R6V45_08865 [Oceanipulchritudo sp.]